VLHRLVLTVSAALLAASLGSAVQAQCGGCGLQTPAIYAAPAQVYAVPASAYAAPAAIPAPVPLPAPVAPAPIAVDHWDTGGCGTLSGCGPFGAPAYGGGGGCGFGRCGNGCGLGGCGGYRGVGFAGCNCGGSVAYVPSPLYVANQGPEYSGPGLMVPYQTYSPGAALAPAINYPYIAPRYRVRYAYRPHVYVHPRYYRAVPRWRD
jgi:hypothetical protein